MSSFPPHLLLHLCLLFSFFLAPLASAADILKTVGAYPCSPGQESIINVDDFTFVFDRSSNNVTYYVQGTSTTQVSIIAHIQISAYGETLLDQDVNLCQENITELCPVPAGNISTSGVHTVPEKYTTAVATVAYKIPDIEGTVTIQILNASDPSQNLGCFSSSISNGVSTDVTAVKFLTIGLAAAALVVSGVSSAANSAGSAGGAPVPVPHATITGTEGLHVGTTGAATSGPGTNVAASGFHSPGFPEFFSVLQSIAISGMYSVNYPSAYRKFTENVGWSVGAITWGGMQRSIDNFRERTGGNITQSSYDKLQQTTLIIGNQTNTEISTSDLANNATQAATRRLVRRLLGRDEFDFDFSDTHMYATNTTATKAASDISKKYVSVVSGIKAYVESMNVPSTNAFMTLLIWWAIIAMVCIAGILSFKLFLELWCWHRKTSKFEGFRQRYWLILGSVIVRLITLLYGVWVLYCLYQFKISDSWGVRLLAGLTLGIFTLIILGYASRISYLARRARKQENGLEKLFQHKPWARKYGLFYDQFKVKFWWAFIPVFLASFGRNAFLALGYGNGLVQIIGQLVIDIFLSGFFIVLQPFNTKMGNYINIAIQICRVVSLIFLLIFTVQLHVNRFAVTGLGLGLIAIQAVLAVSIALLIFTNACMGIMKMTCGGRKNKKKRAELEKLEQEEQERQEELARSQQGQSTHDLLDSYRDEKRVADVEYTSYTSSLPSEPSSGTAPPSPQQLLASSSAIRTHNHSSYDAGSTLQSPLQLSHIRSTSTGLVSGSEAAAAAAAALALTSANNTPRYEGYRGFESSHDLDDDFVEPSTTVTNNVPLPDELRKNRWNPLALLGVRRPKKQSVEESRDSYSSGPPEENLSRLSATSRDSQVYGVNRPLQDSQIPPLPPIQTTNFSHPLDIPSFDREPHPYAMFAENAAAMATATTNPNTFDRARGDSHPSVVSGSVNPKSVRASLMDPRSSRIGADFVTPLQASFGDENSTTFDSTDNMPAEPRPNAGSVYTGNRDSAMSVNDQNPRHSAVMTAAPISSPLAGVSNLSDFESNPGSPRNSTFIAKGVPSVGVNNGNNAEVHATSNLNVASQDQDDGNQTIFLVDPFADPINTSTSSLPTLDGSNRTAAGQSEVNKIHPIAPEVPQVIDFRKAGHPSFSGPSSSGATAPDPITKSESQAESNAYVSNSGGNIPPNLSREISEEIDVILNQQKGSKGPKDSQPEETITTQPKSIQNVESEQQSSQHDRKASSHSFTSFKSVQSHKTHQSKLSEGSVQSFSSARDIPESSRSEVEEATASSKPGIRLVQQSPNPSAPPSSSSSKPDRSSLILDQFQLPTFDEEEDSSDVVKHNRPSLLPLPQPISSRSSKRYSQVSSAHTDIDNETFLSDSE